MVKSSRPPVGPPPDFKELADEWALEVLEERLNVDDEGQVWLGECFSETDDMDTLRAIAENIVEGETLVRKDEVLGSLVRTLVLSRARPSPEERYEKMRELLSDWHERGDYEAQWRAEMEAEERWMEEKYGNEEKRDED